MPPAFFIPRSGNEKHLIETRGPKQYECLASVAQCLCAARLGVIQFRGLLGDGKSIEEAGPKFTPNTHPVDSAAIRSTAQAQAGGKKVK